jgi:hypothetical protein
LRNASEKTAARGTNKNKAKNNNALVINNTRTQSDSDVARLSVILL